jgi:CHC2 zinc finger/Toprim-like
MSDTTDLLTLARTYNVALPRRIRAYLNRRGIPDHLIDAHLLGWNGWRITIPIFNRKGTLVFFKLAKDPEDQRSGPKMLLPPGVRAELYGWEQILCKPAQIIICEGEYDRLVLQANGFRAVTSTGGVGTFRREWAKELRTISEVYICFDRDEAGSNGALRVGRVISHARLIELPTEVGTGGDISDFFVRLGRTRADFTSLMARARLIPPLPEPTQFSITTKIDFPLKERTGRIKSQLPIGIVVGRYVKLRVSGHNLVGLCPFHDDHNPSLFVSSANNTFHCFGCRKHGDVITFIMAIEHLSFAGALEALDRLVKA